MANMWRAARTKFPINNDFKCNKIEIITNKSEQIEEQTPYSIQPLL